MPHMPLESSTRQGPTARGSRPYEGHVGAWCATRLAEVEKEKGNADGDGGANPCSPVRGRCRWQQSRRQHRKYTGRHWRWRRRRGEQNKSEDGEDDDEGGELKRQAGVIDNDGGSRTGRGRAR
jgi:hypothetical protein